MVNEDFNEREDSCSLLAFLNERDAALKSVEKNIKRTRRACIAVISVCAALSAYFCILISMI